MPEAISRPVQSAVEITVTRADGSVEDFGVRSYYHKSWLRTAAVQTIVDRGEVVSLEEINRTSTAALLLRAALPKKEK